jgi:acyl carrier protein
MTGTNLVTETVAETDLSDAMRAVWQRALKKDVRDDDDFFALGGDSLAAVAVCVGLEERFHLRPRLRVLFDRPLFADYVHAYAQLMQET